MSIQLLTIGDSISQGFISGAAAEPSIAYSTLISNAMNNINYNSVTWPTGYKLKYDIESILREVEKITVKNIPLVKIIPILIAIDKVLNKSERYFEKGLGQLGKPIPGAPPYHHNLSVEGMDVADAWLVTPRLCRRIVERDKGSNKNNLFKSASSPFYRNAYRTLNPQSASHHMDKSAISWLEYLSKNEGVDNLILWLGANNALGTIIDLKIKKTDGTGDILHKHREQRQKFNLWDKKDFKDEYSILIEKVINALRNNKSKQCNVYIGNIPLVTISPALKGYGKTSSIQNPDKNMEGKVIYFEKYTHYYMPEKKADQYKKYIREDDALFIDRTILDYNEIINDIVEEKSQKSQNINFKVVDICTQLTKMAYKRNNKSPTYKLPEPINRLDTPINTCFYHTDDNKNLISGGIFSLDGIHPSVVGQGLIAYEFLSSVDNGKYAENLDWEYILSSDSLLTDPIVMNYWTKNKRLRHLFIDAIMAIKGLSSPIKRSDILKRLRY